MKIGDKVRVKDKFWKLGSPTGLSTISGKRNLVGKVLEVEYVYPDGDIRTKYGTLGYNIDTWFIWHPSWLEPVEKTLETLQKGDIVIDRSGDYRKVLSVLEKGELYTMSWISDDLQSDNLKKSEATYTLFELQEIGYKPYIPETEVEMTVAEISKALGKTVKVVE